MRSCMHSAKVLTDVTGTQLEVTGTNGCLSSQHDPEDEPSTH